MSQRKNTGEDAERRKFYSPTTGNRICDACGVVLPDWQQDTMCDWCRKKERP